MSRETYDKHDKAFSQVGAYVLMNGKEQVGTIALKYPKDGAGRLTCYFHIRTLPMVYGTAGGYGYDKASAAVTDAAQKQVTVKLEDWQTSDRDTERKFAARIAKALQDNEGMDWKDVINYKLRGLRVLRAI